MSKKVIYDFEENNDKSLFDLDFVTEGKGKGIEVDPDMTMSAQPKKKKKTTKEKTKKQETTVTEEPVVINQRDLTMSQTNLPYSDTYSETTNLLHTTINEIDNYSTSVRNELESIKASKTLKNKYNYITDLTSTGANLISTKINAIKELNKTITDSHNLELKRQKDMATIGSLNAEQDDSKYIQELYTAFVSNPNMPQNAFFPNQMDFQSYGGDNTLTPMGISITGVTPQQQSQSQNLSPEQLRMRLESDPNVKMVVVYNATTGQKWFEGRNITTGEVIPNYPVLDPMFLEDTQVFVNESVARNINLDQTYPLIVINDNNIGIY